MQWFNCATQNGQMCTPKNLQNYFYHYYFSHFFPLHLNGERKMRKDLEMWWQRFNCTTHNGFECATRKEINNKDWCPIEQQAHLPHRLRVGEFLFIFYYYSYEVRGRLSILFVWISIHVLPCVPYQSVSANPLISEVKHYVWMLIIWDLPFFYRNYHFFQFLFGD